MFYIFSWVRNTIREFLWHFEIWYVRKLKSREAKAKQDP